MKQETGLDNCLKATRSRVGLSQQQLADAAGVTRQTISGIESGLYAPTATVALRLARALGCRMEELFWLEEYLPTVEAHPAASMEAGREHRVSLAQVGNRWVAHSLEDERAFRTEMVPADGSGAMEAGSSQISIKLLDDPENLLRTVVLAGCTPALSLWARSAERWYPGLRVHWIHANSTEGLNALARGEVHAAGIHLFDPETAEHNSPFVREALPGRPITLVNLGAWREGILVQPGNPKRIEGAAELARPRVTLINREPGAGSRFLLDSILRGAGILSANVRGYEKEVRTHQEVAREIASGEADAGVSTEAVANLYGLDFVPLREIRYDLAIPKEFLQQEPVRQLLTTLQHRWVRSQLRILGGFDTTLTGEIVAEIFT